jgi:septal ring factor EnvC (AmiA/AmiB activator)
MEEFISEHPQLVSMLVLALISIVTALGKREFNSIQKHQDAQDRRLDAMSKNIQHLDRDLADSKRDREGLHDEIAAAFKNVEKRLDAMSVANNDAHNMIMRMIRTNGNPA